MSSSWRIARIMGIDIAVDLSWFVIVALLVYSLGFIQFPQELRPRAFFPRPDAVSVTLGVIASLLLFASVLAHELSHSWMAIRRGIPVNRITLFIFGGVAQIATEPDKPTTEFLIAIMGPLMSLALALVFGAAWIWLRLAASALPNGISLTPAIVLFGILAQWNGSLALFNLAPGFPLDGGRVFRAVLWSITHDVRKATRWASYTGQGIAVILIAVAGWLLLTQGNLGALWFALIGFFLWNAASEGYRQTVLMETLRGVTVSQLMTKSIETVSPDMSIIEFVDRYLLARREQAFAVADATGLVGIVTTEHLHHVPRSEWAFRRVRDIMTPLAALGSLSPQQTAAAAMSRLASVDLVELPVVEAGQLVGFVGRDELARFLRLKSGFEHI